MSAIQHIRDYLKTHFAGHDTETLMTHFETAIEAKVEEAIAEVKAELQALRTSLTPTWQMPTSIQLVEPEPVVATDPEPASETGSAA